MRTIMTLAIAALLTGIVATTWAMTQGSAGLKARVVERAVDPIEIMKDAKDLPIEIVLDPV